jgi:hypothetical protein
MQCSKKKIFVGLPFKAVFLNLFCGTLLEDKNDCGTPRLKRQMLGGTLSI